MTFATVETFDYVGANILGDVTFEYFYNVLRDTIFSIKNPFYYGKGYLKKNRKEYKVKSILDDIENMSARNKDDVISEFLTFMPKESNTYSFKLLFENFDKLNYSKSEHKEIFDNIKKAFESLSGDEKKEVLRTTFLNISDGVCSLRHTLSNKVGKCRNAEDIEFLLVVDEALQICDSLSQDILKGINIKKQTQRANVSHFRHLNVLLWILLMRIESLKRGNSTIDALQKDISVTLWLIELDKIKANEEYKISGKKIDDRVYSILEV